MPEATPLLIFATSFIVALSGAMMPGPFLAYTIGEAARRGFWVGPLVILGHALAELGLIIALALGLREIAQSAQVAAMIGLAGGVILIAMAVQIVRTARYTVALTATSSPHITQHKRIVFSGFLLSVTNPAWLIWWGTLGTAYMFWALQSGAIGIASFGAGHVLADLGWYSLVALMVSGGRKFMSTAVYQGLLVFCGLVLLAVGGYFISSGVSYLIG
ncbi:MAG: LysE family transporter [Chloroflexota bacterium]